MSKQILRHTDLSHNLEMKATTTCFSSAESHLQVRGNVFIMKRIVTSKMSDTQNIIMYWQFYSRVMRRVPRRVTARGGEGDPGGGLIAVFLSLPQETQVLLAVAERERGHAVGTAGLIGQVHPRF